MTFSLRKLVRRPPSLQRLLMLVVISQILGAVGLVGYLSFKNGQRAVSDLSEQLLVATGYQVQQELKAFLSTPLQINHLNAAAVRNGTLTLEDPQQLEDRLWTQIQSFESVSYVYITSLQGGMIAAGRDDTERYATKQYLIEASAAYPYTSDYLIFAADQQGNRLSQLQRIPDLDLTEKRWFQKPIAAEAPVWVKPFRYEGREQIIAIAASSPLYDATGTLQGVATVDIVLDHLSTFLKGLTDSLDEQIYIVDRSGQLLAASDKHPSIISRGRASFINAQESPNPLIRESIKSLEDSFGELSDLQQHRTKLKIDDRSYFAQVTPWQYGTGLDWLVVMLVPEDKFMGQIQSNSNVAILLCLLSVAIASALATWTARRISAPILRLSQASESLAEASRNGFEHGIQVLPLKTSGIKEFKTLALGFRQMSTQLQDSHFELESYSQSLEEKVKERTQALEKEISVRKQAEVQSLKAKEAAEAASQVKSEFLANMSHELRSPLNAILGFAQLMSRDGNFSKENLDNISIINRSGEHLLSLINDILDMSKIEAGRASYQPTEVDLHRLLEDIQGMFCLQAAEKQIALEFHYGPNLPPYILTDPSKLRQILINVLNNALKFTESGCIALRVRAEAVADKAADRESQTVLHFEIEDTGCGIDSHEFDRVFEPFVQTSSGEKALEGTGLGLPICRKFAQLMGGEVTFDSPGKGQGTTVSFYIQTQVLPGINLRVRSHKHKVMGLAKGQPVYRLLIVDDKPDNRKLLSKLLAPVGFSLKEACNGHEAVEIAARWSPHLIWMDMRMPVMDGYAAAGTIKQAHCQANTSPPIIVAISASSFKEEQNMALSSGCDDFVQKPLRATHIFDAIAQHLSVRYRYATPDAAIESGQAGHSPPIENNHIDSDKLQALPQPLISELENAALRLQWTQLHQIVDQIRLQDAALAATLTQAIHHFQYSAILQAIQTPSALQETAS